MEKEVRKVTTAWPVAEYVIVDIGRIFILFKDRRSLVYTSYNLHEVESRLNEVIENCS